MEDKPFSQACENNKAVIAQALLRYFVSVSRVLEIGSGSGQHAVYFAPLLGHLQWHCSDQIQYHSGINAWIDEFTSPNLHRPVALSFPHDPWPELHIDGVFSANTAHIMQKSDVKHMMNTISMKLLSGGIFCQYGPFLVDGKFSSQSNADFHQKLIDGGYGGYRGIEELQQWAPLLTLTETLSMPANNLLLVWKKGTDIY